MNRYIKISILTAIIAASGTAAYATQGGMETMRCP